MREHATPLAMPSTGAPRVLFHPGASGPCHGPSTRRLRALIVEDEFIIALELEMLLSDLGVEIVGSAATAEKALKMAAELAPDFVTMDVRLSGQMDGIDAAIELFNRHRLRPIFVSAYKDPEMMQRAKAAHPLGWVRKPVSATALRAVLPTPSNTAH